MICLLFELTIEEEVSENFTIEVNTYEEAVNFAKEKYDKGELVLEPGYLISKRLAITNDKKVDGIEWIEF